MTVPRWSLLLLSLASTAPLAAQDPTLPSSPRFVEILRLVQDGRADSARTTMGGLLTTMPPTDASYAEALYTAAIVSSSGAEARLLFSRVVVEYPRSGWADRSLLWLAQLDFGQGDTEGTVTRIRRLMSDYPESPVLAHGALWGSRAAFERRENALACEWLTRGLQHVGENVELRNQMGFARQRCTSGDTVAAAPPTDTARREPIRTPEARPLDPREAAPPPATPPAAGEWRVQVSAISDPAAIRRLEATIRRLGLTPYRVAGPGNLTKVQAGPFATRDAATARVAELRSAVGGQPFVTRAP